MVVLIEVRQPPLGGSTATGRPVARRAVSIDAPTDGKASTGNSAARLDVSMLTPREREVAILVGRGYSNLASRISS